MKNSIRYLRFGALVTLLALMPAIALAPWFAPNEMFYFPMYVVFPIARIVLIPVAIAIETVALRLLFTMSWRNAGIASLKINAVSLGAGIVLYPLVGWVFDAFLSDMVYAFFGRSEYVKFVAALIGSAIIDTSIEVLFLFAFGIVIGVGWLRAGVFLLANFLSAVFVLTPLYVVMYKPYTPPSLSSEEATRIELEFAPEIALVKEILEEVPDQIILDEKPWVTWKDQQWQERRSKDLTSTRIVRWSITDTNNNNIWIVKNEPLFLLSWYDTEALYQRGDVTIEAGLFKLGHANEQGLVEYAGEKRAYRYQLEMRDGLRRYIMLVYLVP